MKCSFKCANKKKDGDENLCEDIRQWLENKIEQKKTKELKKCDPIMEEDLCQICFAVNFL